MSVETLAPANAPLMPGPRGLPLIGVAHRFLFEPLPYFKELVATYGPIQRVKLGPKEMVLLHDPEGIRHVLWKEGKKYPKPDFVMTLLEPLLGRGVATVTNWDEWMRIRRYVLPLFTPKMLQAYFEHANVSAREDAEMLAADAGKGAVVDIYERMHEAMFRILLGTIFSGGIGKHEVPELTALFNSTTHYMNARYMTLGLPVAEWLPSARRGKADLARIDERVYRMIAERRAENRTESRDMLDVLLAERLPDGSPIPEKEIRDNCMTMLFGGHETTAGSLTWAFGLLAANPDKRAKMFEEIDRVLEGRAPTHDDLKRLTYTEMVFDEAMRLYPMFGFLFREASEDDVVSGYPVKKGTLIAFCAYTAHRDARYWNDPEAFVPERFSPEEKDRHYKAGAYLPFSQGQRACIGERAARMEALLLLAQISQRVQLDLAEGVLPEPKVSESIKPKGGMKMRVTRRGG